MFTHIDLLEKEIYADQTNFRINICVAHINSNYEN
jgi:hypothetical protein